MDLFGGTIVPWSEVETRVKSDGKSLLDIVQLLQAPQRPANFRNALLLPDGATISGDFAVDTQQKWLKKNQIGFIVCFGDLTIDGDFLNNDESYWPVVYVGGSLKCCNMLKGGAPLLIRGDVILSGYYVGEYNDGPVRVGGRLTALGYIPQVRGRDKILRHSIAGGTEARTFNAAADYSRDELMAAVSDSEVLNYNCFNVYKLLQRGRSGVSIWRDENEPYQPVSREAPPPVPALKPAALEGSGAIQPAQKMRAALEALVAEKIEYDPERYSYPASFSEFIGYHYQSNGNGNILVLPDGCRLDGDLWLDWEDGFIREKNISVVYCPGDLTVTGTIRNKSLNGGPMLFVGGTLYVDNLIKGGATVIVLGDVVADGLVLGEYNDGVTRIGGDVRAKFLVSLDHDLSVRGKIDATQLNEDEDEFRAILVDSVFLDEGEEWPDVDLLWAHQQAGRAILLSDV